MLLVFKNLVCVLQSVLSIDVFDIIHTYHLHIVNG